MTGLKPEAFVPPLEILLSLFEKYGRRGQARVIENILAAVKLGPEFVTRLQSGEFWGSSGSVVDAIDLVDPPRSEEAVQDSITATRAIIEIADLMAEQGIDCEGSRFIGAAERKGLRLRGIEP